MFSLWRCLKNLADTFYFILRDKFSTGISWIVSHLESANGLGTNRSNLLFSVSVIDNPRVPGIQYFEY